MADKIPDQKFCDQVLDILKKAGAPISSDEVYRQVLQLGYSPKNEQIGIDTILALYQVLPSQGKARVIPSGSDTLHEAI